MPFNITNLSISEVSPHIGDLSFERRRCDRSGACEMSSAVGPLTMFEVSVGGRDATPASRHLVVIQCEAHRASGFTPFESGILEDTIKA
jgi:hypothetical protein